MSSIAARLPSRTSTWVTLARKARWVLLKTSIKARTMSVSRVMTMVNLRREKAERVRGARGLRIEDGGWRMDAPPGREHGTGKFREPADWKVCPTLGMAGLTRKLKSERERARPGRSFPRPRGKPGRTGKFQASEFISRATAGRGGASSHARGGRDPQSEDPGLTGGLRFTARR